MYHLFICIFLFELFSQEMRLNLTSGFSTDENPMIVVRF